MINGQSCFGGHCLVNLDGKEFEALERLLDREKVIFTTVHAQLLEHEIAAAREAEWLERIRLLEEKVSRLETGVTLEHRVVQRRRTVRGRPGNRREHVDRRISGI